jgi:4-hydroxy-tetrahydrodipicolinate synthase
MKPYWQGVFPAITTQMNQDGSLDLDGTARHAEVLIKSGVAGLVFLGSLGENQSMTAEEKRLTLEVMVKAVAGRVPVLSGVAESSCMEACRYVKDCEGLGADGFMLMPPMIYKTPDTRESLAHFRTVAKATGLPIMIYNNPISYGHDITPELFAELADQKNFVALKESSGNTRRITDLHNLVGGRYAIFTGVDDLALESAILGIDGWVAGTGIAAAKGGGQEIVLGPEGPAMDLKPGAMGIGHQAGRAGPVAFGVGGQDQALIGADPVGKGRDRF